MIEKIQTVLESLCGLNINKPVLAGVSGGADSLCLMDVLANAGYRLTVVHLNHGLRPEADSEAEQVRKYARKLRVEFIGAKIDVNAFMSTEHLALEEAARIVRYRFLFSKAIEIGAQAVAVGHTADDQVETILMHLLRGAGLAGLRGMQYRTIPTAWSNDIPLVRPLLGVWRAEILEFILSRGYTPVFDASNLDITYFRNRLRHELIPMLESYNPMLRRNLWQMGEILREDYRYIQRQVQAAWNACILESGDDYLVFARPCILEQPEAIQRYLFKMAIEVLRPGIRDLDYLTLERARNFLSTPTRSRKVEITQGLVLTQSGERLILSEAGFELLASKYPYILPGATLELQIPGEVHLAGGWLIRSTLLNNSPELLEVIRANTDPFQAWIEADMHISGFKMRSRLPGDRFKPIGMKGHSLKLSDFMINVKLPQAARPGYPLLCGECDQNGSDNILWVPGFRQSDDCRVSSETQRIIWLILKKVKPED